MSAGPHDRASLTKAGWTTLFGVVPDHGLHRRSSDVFRAIVGVLLFALGTVGALSYSHLERSIHNVVEALPDPILAIARVANGGGVTASILVV